MKNKLNLLATMLFMSACHDPSTIRVRLYSQESSDAIVEGSKFEDVIREAGYILGHEIKFVENWQEKGSIAFEIIETKNEDMVYGGRRLITKGCYRAAWGFPDAQVIAHEFGHMLGLSNHKDNKPGNLMYPNSGPGHTDITILQQEVLDNNLARFNRCI